MNKGLEVIEAHELFGVDFDQIDVVVHPQSVVHGMVEFVDGATIAQLSMPDMRLPIGLALGAPDRLPEAFGAIDWTTLSHAHVRAARPRDVPGARPRLRGRPDRRHRAGRAQRGQRGRGRGLPRRPDRLARDRRIRRRSPRRRAPGTPRRSQTFSMQTGSLASGPPPSIDQQEQRGEGPARARSTVPQMRLGYWIALFVGVLVIAAFLFPGAVAIVGVILALPIIIFLHELAHFVTAKRSGMKVTEFFVGFGPRLWSVQKGETEYGLKAIPLGGYCKIIGMTNLEEVPPEDEPRAYRSKRYGPKVLVASAGSVMHFALALVLMFGVLVFAGQLPRRARTRRSSASSSPVRPPTKAGLQKGDELVSVDGEPLEQWEDLRPMLLDRGGDTVTFTVERDGEQVDDPRHARDDRQPRREGRPGGAEEPRAGPVSRRTSTCRRSGSVQAFVETPRQVWNLGTASVAALGERFSPSGISDYWHTLTDNGDDDDATTGSGSAAAAAPRLRRFGAVPVDRRLRAARGAGDRVGLGRGRVPADLDQRVRRDLQPGSRCCRSTAATSRSRPTRRSRRRCAGGRCGSTSRSCCR